MGDDVWEMREERPGSAIDELARTLHETDVKAQFAVTRPISDVSPWESQTDTYRKKVRMQATMLVASTVFQRIVEEVMQRGVAEGQEKLDQDAARVSRMTFLSVEFLEMYHDVVLTRLGTRDMTLEGLIKEIKEYRHERGWSPDGYGYEGEQG